MHLRASETYYLHVYNVESGSWVSLTLDSPVSPHSVEAMNLILSQDGILAYIDMRSESGVKYSELKNETGKDLRLCWTSLPASTIMSMLGLCLNSANLGKPLLAFYGSPLTLVLAYVLELKSEGKDYMNPRKRVLYPSSHGYLFEIIVKQGDGRVITHWASVDEYHDALSYLEESEKDEEIAQEIGRETSQ
jgi:hypothetical protein